MKSLSIVAKQFWLSTKKHSPEILTGIGIAGMITTVVIAVKSTPKAIKLIDEKKEENNAEVLAPVETIKTAWFCYIPAMVIGVMSVCCLIGANSVNLRRNAALATAYALSESALKEYSEKVIETIGDKKESTIRDAIAQDKLNQNPVTNTEVFITDKGNTLCYDVLSGRYFRSDIDKIKKIENELNRQMRDDMYISLNDFYYELGLEPTEVGNSLGWNIQDDYINLDFRAKLASDGTPCLVIDYNNGPKYDFRRFM